MQPTKVQTYFKMPPRQIKSKIPAVRERHTASAFIDQEGRPEIDKIFYAQDKGNIKPSNIGGLKAATSDKRS